MSTTFRRSKVAYLTREFKPNSLPNLLTWYSAEAEAGTNNVRLPTWHDQSGLGNHTASASGGGAIYKTTSGPAGGPALNFDNTCYYTLPSNILLGATAGEIFVNLIQSPAANTGLWGFGADTGASDESHYPFSGTVYDAFGCATGKRISFGYAGTGAWHVFHVWNANNDHSALIDGVVKASSVVNGAVAWTPNPTLGVGKRNIGLDLKFTGFMTTLLLFSRKLTTTERANVLAYMALHPSGGTP